MPYFDRFDIVEAYYLFCSEYHSGQWSDEYKMLCRITSKLKFKPRPSLNDFESLEENGKEIYANLVRKHYQKEVDCKHSKFYGQPPYIPYLCSEGNKLYVKTKKYGGEINFAPNDKDRFIFPELIGKDEVVVKDVNGHILEKVEY